MSSTENLPNLIFKKNWTIKQWGANTILMANPWMPYHELFTGKIASIVGAKEKEVAVTHSLTTNLHLLMVSFYRPDNKRNKII